ncbi:MAG TPA: NYN domain-containing protein [Nitrospiria bacterium]|nr:NYN domain-containing protein [Nitrospiria bacterium]
MASSDEEKIALFIDLENVALGARDAKYGSFEIERVIKRLVEKGKLIAKKAYADWEHYREYTRPFNNAGVELIDIPRQRGSGKNSADIKMVVDAMEMGAAKEHVTIFAIASGDSDFTPLVSKLKENDKYVIGIGVKNSTSALLSSNCDEFIYYEDLVRRTPRKPKSVARLPQKKKECFELLLDSMDALQREDKEVLWGSMVKQTMKRKNPSFNESYYGYRSFSHLLEDAAKHHLIEISRDAKSRSYVISPLGDAS